MSSFCGRRHFILEVNNVENILQHLYDVRRHFILEVRDIRKILQHLYDVRRHFILKFKDIGLFFSPFMIFVATSFQSSKMLDKSSALSWCSSPRYLTVRRWRLASCPYLKLVAVLFKMRSEIEIQEGFVSWRKFIYNYPGVQ